LKIQNQDFELLKKISLSSEHKNTALKESATLHTRVFYQQIDSFVSLLLIFFELI
jgi:hypothetical protein